MNFENFEIYFFVISLSVLFFLIDDLFIDFISIFKKLGPKAISRDDLYDVPAQSLKCTSLPRYLAIMVANWQEESVLESMVHGNMKNISDKEVHLFLGVYPNDSSTLAIALKMQSQYPNVHTVINTQKGPTYKGQMLNEIIKGIFLKETELGISFSGFIMHDSEDILDPHIPALYKLGLKNHDFVQTPVFSLPSKFSELTAGTYMDEFAEVHCKDLLVRKYLGAALPSAGVGTCISRKLILTFLTRQEGRVFLPDSLTEDYQLGLQASQWGFRSTFLCHYLKDQGPSYVIATKEFFPNKLKSAIRQKTRWTTGIAFQGSSNLGWFGNFWQRYFLWRDRKGPINALLTLNIIFIICITSLGIAKWVPENQWLTTILIFNTIGMVVRFAVRTKYVHRLYGWKHASLVVFRWPPAMLINMCAGLKSIYQHTYSSVTGSKIKWAKTEHRLPEGFGGLPTPKPTPAMETQVLSSPLITQHQIKAEAKGPS